MVGRIIFLMMICLLLASPAKAESKAEKIHQLMELTGATKNMKQILEYLWPKLSDAILKSNPSMKPDTLASLKALGQHELEGGIPEMGNQVEKIYDINFSDAEVDALLTFYNSPLGQSAMAKMPIILSQSMSVGQAWGNQIGQKIVARVAEELKKNGYNANL